MAEQKVKNEIPIPCKLILVGESGVGKTSIITRYLNKYQEKTESTLGAFLSNKAIIIDGYKINLDIWVTAGQEQYRSINALFYKDASICLMVYDITNKNTFNSIKDYWYDSVYQTANQGIIFGVAGNKNDLFEEEDVDENEAKEYCDSIKACFKLTSAKSNQSIDDIFQMLAENFVKSDFMNELIPKYVTNEVKSDTLKLTKNDSIKINKDTIVENKNKNKISPQTNKNRSKCC